MAVPWGPVDCTKAGGKAATPPAVNPSTTTDAPETFEADTATKTPCPSFLDSQKGFKLAGVTAKLDCTSGELTYTDGLALGVKYSFATRELEIFAGVGGSSKLSSYDPVSVTAKVGVTLTFADGKVVDAGGKADVEATFDADGLQGKYKVSATWSVVTPPTITTKDSQIYAFK
jgi:hypothetical protein